MPRLQRSEWLRELAKHGLLAPLGDNDLGGDGGQRLDVACVREPVKAAVQRVFGPERTAQARAHAAAWVVAQLLARLPRRSSGSNRQALRWMAAYHADLCSALGAAGACPRALASVGAALLKAPDKPQGTLEAVAGLFGAAGLQPLLLPVVRKLRAAIHQQVGWWWWWQWNV